MKRIATLIAAGALVLAATSTASAQINLSFGNPLTGRGTVMSFGQPGFVGQPGFIGQRGFVGQRGFIGQPYGLASPYATGYTGYSGYGLNTLAPYGAGTSYYSSGYRGFAAPSATIIRRSYSTLPYGYGTGYGVGSPYTSGFGSPYGIGGLNYNRGLILPLR